MNTWQYDTAILYKVIPTGPCTNVKDILHVCYCHEQQRFIWNSSKFWDRLETEDDGTFVAYFT